MRGIDIFIELLAQYGVKHIFGNPGTTELPLNDALVGDRRLQYVLGLQEIPVMAMADGFAMASGQIAVVNLHASCGLGNAMGMLYNAYREGTPLLVTAGQQHRRLRFQEPILYGELAEVARPWTKWSHEVSRIEDLAPALRRAIQTALTPPTGPVFLALPVDLQTEVLLDADVAAASLPDNRVRPPLAAVHQAAELLANAKNPVILAGSRVTSRDGTSALVRLAELLGAPVYSEATHNHGRLPFPCDHPLYGQAMPMWTPEIRALLSQFDLVFIAGMDLFRHYVFHEPQVAIPPETRLIHLDEDPWQLGKNFPLAVGLIGDTQAGLLDLCDVLAAGMSAEQNELALARSAGWQAAHEENVSKLRERIRREGTARPMTPLTLMSTLAETLPSNVAVIEEAVTTTNHTFERLGALKNTTGYFAQRGWALGWGLGCSLGVKLAWPERPVLALLGEGAASYGIQGLWSAARYGIGVTFVICNNGEYGILKRGALSEGYPAARQGRFEGMDLDTPAIDLVGIATSFGVDAKRIEEPSELARLVADSFSSDKPLLIDVPIAKTFS